MQHPLDGLQIHHGVGKRGEAAAPLVEVLDAGEHPGAQRRAVLLVVVRQELVLDLRQVYV